MGSKLAGGADTEGGAAIDGPADTDADVDGRDSSDAEGRIGN